MATSQILRPDRNCWRIEPAERVAFLVDGAAYFRALHSAITRARERIYILSWDIDSRFKLIRDEPFPVGWPLAIGELLDTAVRRSKHLEVYILNWDFAMIYVGAREFMPIYRFDWTTHRRMHFAMDNQHPIGASHHQKVVVIDDAVAFAGGLDITMGRWDTVRHRVPDRQNADGKDQLVRPYHDIQMAVSGPVAAALGALARRRWQRATGVELAAPRPGGDPWPPALHADLTNVPVAIARTEPQYLGYPQVREVENLYLDTIAAARRLIYIENQYFTSGRIGAALAKRLEEPDGPEIILVSPLETDGWLSRSTLDVWTAQLFRHLQQTDRHGHLRLYYPSIPENDQPVNVHDKLMIMDDELLRIGSANLNNRSMGLDTECDLAIEACGDPRIQRAIAGLRNRLLGEHLNRAITEVDQMFAECDSAIAAIERLRRPGRTLQPMQVPPAPSTNGVLSYQQMIDPEYPIGPDELVRHLIGSEQIPPTRRRIGGWVALLVVMLALAAAWHWTPLRNWMDVGKLLGVLAAINNHTAAPVLVMLAYIVASMIAAPITVLIFVTILAFGPWIGVSYAFAGVMLGAIGSYALGYQLGRNTVRRLAGSRLNRLSNRLAQRGLLAMIALRIIPVAPFTVINLVAGASRIRFRDYCIGTLVGITPGILAIALFADRMIASIHSPAPKNLAALAIVGLLIAAGAWAFSRWLKKRTRTDSDDSAVS